MRWLTTSAPRPAAPIRRPAIPDELSGIFRRMGDVASRIADGARVTLTTSDAQDAARLEVDDDAMDGLRRALFRALVDDWSHGVEAAVNVALLGRYYERFADHAVAIAQSVIFIVTGTKPDDRSTSCRVRRQLRAGTQHGR